MLQGAIERVRGIASKVMDLVPVRFVMRVLKKSSANRVGAYSAQIAFYILMTVFPMVILFLQLIKAAPISQESILYAIDNVFPDYLLTTLHELLQEVYSASAGLVPITIITMLWTISKVMHAMTQGLDTICTTEDARNWMVVRFWSILCTGLVFAIAVVVAASFIGWRPLKIFLIRHRPQGMSLSGFSDAIDVIYTMVIGVLSLSFLYKILPRRKLRFVAQFPGALFTVFAIMLLSNALSIYVGRFNGFSAYGSLTTLTLAMFWLYFSCYFLMMGAVINEVLQEFGAQLSHRWGPAKRRARKAIGPNEGA
ncbi:MAG: YihY/virulence factor BrkB family protein [Atopobiaceae bacterium]|nr:YihY/virulence factor BrkB family protein [Atopobiaceae bacterium]